VSSIVAGDVLSAGISGGEKLRLQMEPTTVGPILEDVMEAIRPFEGKVESAPVPYEAPLVATESDESATSKVEELLGPSPVPVDEIIRLSGVPSGAVQMALLELDLAGRLERHAGNRVSLASG